MTHSSERRRAPFSFYTTRFYSPLFGDLSESLGIALEFPRRKDWWRIEKNASCIHAPKRWRMKKNIDHRYPDLTKRRCSHYYRVFSHQLFPSHRPVSILSLRLHSPITYVHPSAPAHTSCLLPASTSNLPPTPKISFVGCASSGYEMVNSPLRIKCVVRPECLCGE